MTYSPNPRVRIGGTDFTGNAVNQVSVFRGRRTVYERPNAGYASAELIDVDGIAPFRVGQEFEVAVDRARFVWEGLADSWAGLASTWQGQPPIFVSVPIFTGTLSELFVDVEPTRGRPVARYRLTAVGPLATLNRRQVFFTGRAAENDAERVEATLVAALGTALVNPDLIDDGVFDLAAIGADDAGFNALTVAQDAGFSGEGILFENEDGFIGYHDADRRLENERAGVLTVPFGQVSAAGVTLLEQLADITNRVTVEYATGAVTEDDTVSIGDFGLFETSLRTGLVNLSNAETRALQFLSRHALPRRNLDQLRFNLLGVNDDLRNALLELGDSDALRVTQVPAGVGFAEFRGFVEGFQLLADPFSADMTFVVSDRRLSIGAQRWGQVDGTIQWQDVDAALTWADADEVTV